MKKIKINASILKICFIACIGILLFSCKTKYPRNSVSEKSHLLENKEQLFDQLVRKQAESKSLDAKIYFTFDNNGKTFSSKAFLKMNDKNEFSISIRPILGFEVCKLFVDNNKIFLIDRINKAYVSEKFENFTSDIIINKILSLFHSLFNNDIFTVNKDRLEEEDIDSFRFNIENNKLRMISDEQDELIDYGFLINEKGRLEKTTINQKNKNISLTWDYDDFIEENNNQESVFPKRMQITLNENNKRYRLDIDFLKIKMNAPVNIIPEVSSSYKKIPLSEIIKSIF